MLTDGRSGAQPAPPGETTQPAPPPRQPASSTAPASTTTTSSTASTQRSAQDYENAVRQYYALLPANPAAGWEQLTERAQRRSGSQDEYNRFWSRIRSVEVRKTDVEDGNRVKAELRFVTDRGDSKEEYVFTLVDRDGKLLIDDFDNDD
jgi:hypothetical protein